MISRRGAVAVGVATAIGLPMRSSGTSAQTPTVNRRPDTDGCDRDLQFAGRSWHVTSGFGQPTGFGPNLFSDVPANLEHATINRWLCVAGDRARGQSPADGWEAEIVVRDFRFAGIGH